MYSRSCFTLYFLHFIQLTEMPPKKRQGRKKNPVWLHFIEGPLLNSSHHEAQCRYCFGKMGGVPSNMLKHLKEECSNISEELRNIILYDSDNINNKTKKNKRSRVEAELSDDDDGN